MSAPFGVTVITPPEYGTVSGPTGIQAAPFHCARFACPTPNWKTPPAIRTPPDSRSERKCWLVAASPASIADHTVPFHLAMPRVSEAVYHEPPTTRSPLAVTHIANTSPMVPDDSVLPGMPPPTWDHVRPFHCATSTAGTP